MKRLLRNLALMAMLCIPWVTQGQTLFSEDFEEGSMPTGWTQEGTNSSSWSIATNVNSIHPNSAGHGDYCAQIKHGTTSATKKLITPEINLSTVTSAELSFMYVHQSWSGDVDELRVYYRTSSSGTWTLLDGQVYSDAQESWTTADGIALPNLSSTYQLAFEFNDNWGYGLGIDNIVIVQGASCVKPTGLAATLTPGDGSVATLSWTKGGEETNWVLEYSTSSTFASDVTTYDGSFTVEATTVSADLMMLTPETTYYARVKADCGGGDVSDWSATCEFTPTNILNINIFGTTSSTSSYLPSHTNFDYSYTQQIYTAAEMGSFPCTLQSVAFKGNKAAVCDLDIYLANTTKSSFTGTTDYIAISDATLVFSGQVTFTANDWTTITFDNEFDYEGGNLAVIVDDNSGNYSYGSTTWQTFNTTTAQALYFYQDGTDINPTSPSASYKGTPSLKSQIKFVYELPSPYAKPLNLDVTNLTATGATITWEAPNSDVQSYKYQYREEGGSWSALTSTTSLSAPLSGLTGNTTYEFQVQALYADDNESAFASKSFTTLISIPYVYGFEDANEFNKWETVDCEDDVTSGLNGLLSYADYAHSGNGFFAFSSYNGADYPQYLISPELSGIVNGLHVAFYYRSANNNDPETFMVGYSTTDKNPDSFTWSDEVTSPDDNYYPYAVNFMNPAIKYVAVKYTSEDSYYLFVDDFTFEEAPDCLEPTNVDAINITTTTADITWTNGGSESSWDIFATDDATIVPDGTTTPTVSGVTTKPHQLTLNPGTTYYVYVRSACSSTETSTWSSPKVFHTDCEGMDLPYGPYGFEDGALTVCWNHYSDNLAYNSASVYNGSTYAHDGTKSLRFYRGSTTGDLVLALPVIDDSYDLSDYQFEFYAYANGTNMMMTIGIMDDPNDLTTFVAQGTEFNPATSYTEYKVRFNGYTGTGKYVAIKVTRPSGSSGSIYMDDIAINPIPSCIEPSALTVSAETAHGATFGWTAGSSESAWQLYFSTSNVAPADDIADNAAGMYAADENPFTLTTGLNPETDYYVWVRANCGGTDGKSTWVGPETFSTTVACPAPTALAASEITNHTAKLSWTGTSDEYIVSYRTAAYVNGLEEEFGTSIPTGWTIYSTLLNDDVLNGTTSLTATTGYWNFGTSNGVFDNHARLNIYGTARKYWLVTPATELSADATLSFDLALTAFSGNLVAPATDGTDDRFVVLISTDNKTTWTILREWNNSGSSYVYNNINATATGENVNISLSTYAGETAYIAFYGESTESNADNYLHIDNVTIGTLVAAGAWQTVDPNPTASPVTITGLEAETKYEVKVQGDCGTEGQSLETSIFFTTDIPCPAPTGLAVAGGLTSSQVNLSWTNGGAANWVVAYKKTADENFTEINLNESAVTIEGNLRTYTLGGLDAETEYTVKVRDNCEASHAGDGVSEWTATVYFTTLAACSLQDVAVSNVGAHVADVAWNGESNDGFTVSYRTAAYVNGLEEEFGTSIPTGWTNMTGLLADVMSGSATLISGSQWSFGTSNGVFDSHAKINIYGSGSTEHKGWLITPTFTLPAGATMSFDLALTAYYGTLGAPATTGTDDRFVVLVYADDAWTILREWNNDDSPYVYNNIANTATGETVDDIDISAYEGKTVKFAFYGESTVSNADNNLHIDNVTIGTAVAAGDWQTIHTDATSTPLTELTAGTKYEVKVQPDCKPTLVSDPVIFNTLALPTKDITANSWYAIASPMHNSGDDETVAGVTNLATGTYDLYRYNEGHGTWENSVASGFDELERGRGYLYRNEDDVTLTFDGEPNSGDISIGVTSDCEDNVIKGFNLVGNPRNAAYAPTVNFYRLNTNGTWTAKTASPSSKVDVAEAFLIHVNAVGNYYFGAGAKGAPVAQPELRFSVSNEEFTDVAYAQFDGGESLPKVSHLNAEAPVLSIPVEGRNYAIAALDNSVERFPLSFRGQGQYTLTVENGTDYGYLHLIDRVNGTDVDLLRQPTYTFYANGSADRFMVKLSPSMDEEGNVTFVRVSGNSVVVDGDGMLQVFDVMGRQLGTAQVDGTTTFSRSELGLNHSGVYVMRLNGESQKIVVK